MSAPAFEPFKEPLHKTLLRTVPMAVAIGVIVGVAMRRPVRVPLITLMALWFTLGVHVAELLFLNRLRRALEAGRPVATIARLLYWFVSGLFLSAGALATQAVLTGRRTPWPWWTGGAILVAMELFVHLIMRLRRIPSFYDGRG